MRIETGPAPSGTLRTENTGNPDENTWAGPTTVIQTNQPVTVLPLPARDSFGKEWVFFGTGRMLNTPDKGSTTQQALYGIRDNGSVTTTVGTLLDVTNAEVMADGTEIVNNIPGVSNFTELTAAVEAAGGWRRTLEAPGGTSPSERNVTTSGLLGDILFMTTYTPNNDQCASEGNSRLYGLFYQTGTASSRPVFGTGTNINGDPVSLPSIDLGQGQAASPSLHSGAGGNTGELSIFTQTSTGSIVVNTGQTSAKESGEINWREITE